MKAAEARKLVNKHESVDNTAIVLVGVRDAAEKGKTSVEVDESLITLATDKHLVKLGYDIVPVVNDEDYGFSPRHKRSGRVLVTW